MSMGDFQAPDARAGFGTSMARAPARGSFVDDLNQAVRENPVSAALIGLGVLWMFMGGSRKTRFDGAGTALGAAGEAAQGAAGAAAGGVQQAVGAIGSGVHQAGSMLAGGLGSAASAIGSAASAAAGAAGAAARGTGAMIGEAAERAGGGIGSAYDSGAGSAVRASHALSSGAAATSHQAQQYLSEWSGSVRHGLADTFERQPLLLGAVGAVLGAVVASALPVTGVENRMLGETSDALKEQASDLLSEKAGQAESMARTALQEAERKGLTPQAAAVAAGEIADKAATVADEARSTLVRKAGEALSGNGRG